MPVPELLNWMVAIVSLILLALWGMLLYDIYVTRRYRPDLKTPPGEATPPRREG